MSLLLLFSFTDGTFLHLGAQLGQLVFQVCFLLLLLATNLEVLTELLTGSSHVPTAHGGGLVDMSMLLVGVSVMTMRVTLVVMVMIMELFFLFLTATLPFLFHQTLSC